MFFHKKKQLGPVPVEEVQKLTASGMSDKDVIKRLKSVGYQYEEIEKALVSAVKRGVDKTSFQPYNPMQQHEKPQFPDLPELNEYRPEEKDLIEGLQEVNDDINPDIIVEEIVEGVVEEKWRKFEDKMKKMENDFITLSTQMKQAEQRPAKEQPAKDYDPKISDITEQMEDLQARVGGLEKAFKQFLPSLTKNIESLSNLIHEMKEKQGMVAQEM